MKNGFCSKCGTASVFEKPEGVKFSAMQGVAFVNTGGPTRGTPAMSYVCTNCGYFENYLLDPHKLAQVEQTWHQVPASPQ
jgi:hypothetical protein